jgi:hypothetical protein
MVTSLSHIVDIWFPVNRTTKSFRDLVTSTLSAISKLFFQNNTALLLSTFHIHKYVEEASNPPERANWSLKKAFLYFSLSHSGFSIPASTFRMGIQIRQHKTKFGFTRNRVQSTSPIKIKINWRTWLPSCSWEWCRTPGGWDRSLDSLPPQERAAPPPYTVLPKQRIGITWLTATTGGRSASSLHCVA